MKLRLSFLPICAMLLLAGAFFTGCTQTNTPGTTNNKFTDTWRDMPGLTDGQTYQFSVTGASASTYITGVSSWTSGTVRVFWNRASGDTTDVKVNTSGTTSPSISWAPAVGTSRLHIFETSAPASVGPSGLILGNPSTTALTSGSNKGNIDLVLATTPAAQPFPNLQLQAADQGAVSGGKATELGTNPINVKGGLAMDHYGSGDLGGLIPSTNSIGFYDFKDWATITDSSSIVVLVRTADNHYARVEVIPQPVVTGKTGNYLWGDDAASGKRFIDVNVSYQTTAGLAYAGRPNVIRRGTNTHRRQGGLPIIEQ